MRKFIITGSSRGIGKAVVKKALSYRDIDVTGISRTNELSHEHFNHIPLNLEDSSNIIGQIDKIFKFERDYRQIVLINNAGYLGDVKHAGDIKSEEYAKVYAINLTATAILMNEFIRKTKGIDAEKIILNISSGAGRKSDYDGWSAYSSSKAAVDLLSQVVAKEREIEGNGYKIFALAPGVVETQMQRKLRQTRASDFSNVERFIKMNEEGSSASPDFIAEKLIKFIDNINEYDEVLQDLRKLNL